MSDGRIFFDTLIAVLLLVALIGVPLWGLVVYGWAGLIMWLIWGAVLLWVGFLVVGIVESLRAKAVEQSK